VEGIARKHSTDSLQKSAVLGTSHIIRKVLQSETWSLSNGDHHWLKRRSGREKRLVTRDTIIITIIIITIVIIITYYNSLL
jgi:hypothetical protein